LTRYNRLVYAGDIPADIVFYVPALPKTGEDVFASESYVHAGGAFNVLSTAVRQGLPAAYAGPRCAGPFFDVIRGDLDAASIVDLSSACADDADATFTVVLVDASGERTFITHPAIGRGAALETLNAVLVKTTDIVYLSGYSLIQQSAAEAFSDWLHLLPTQTCVAFDPQPMVGQISPEILKRVLNRCDWISANEAEAAELTAQHDPATACSHLAEQVNQGAVVRLAGRGCVVARQGFAPHLIEPFAVEVVDANGAGDAHVGTFLAALAAGLEPPDAARRANASAALTVARRGHATAPTAAEVSAFMSQ
jgi:sugar/nucleoside kinase (ribokinase family)